MTIVISVTSLEKQQVNTKICSLLYNIIGLLLSNPFHCNNDEILTDRLMYR